MKTADLEAEMHRALANIGPDLFAELVGAAVPPLAIVDLMVGVELIDYTDDGLYFPDSAGKRAFITPVRVQFPDSPQSTDPSAFVRTGDLIDLIAWNIGDRDCGALRLGCAAWLGCTEVQEYPDLVKPGPTRLWHTTLEWFRANLEGLVVTSTDLAEQYRLLAQLHGGIEVEDAAHKRELDGILRRPWPAPRVRVAPIRHRSDREPGSQTALPRPDSEIEELTPPA
jgi:hypothetical protein